MASRRACPGGINPPARPGVIPLRKALGNHAPHGGVAVWSVRRGTARGDFAQVSKVGAVAQPVAGQGPTSSPGATWLTPAHVIPCGPADAHASIPTAHALSAPALLRRLAPADAEDQPRAGPEVRRPFLPGVGGAEDQPA